MATKKIKVKICNYDENAEYKHTYGNFLHMKLKELYDVELSETPDYIFFTEGNFDYQNYDAVRIFYTGENHHPNFNLCDYAFAFDYMEFGDRYYRFPVYMAGQFYQDADHELMKKLGGPDFAKPVHFTKEDLANKTGFCSFVYKNYLADSPREAFFHKLSSEYKQVDSGGMYLNNTVQGLRLPKLEFELSRKFSIAFENTSNIGYTTEKLPNSLMARTIPIYWGNPEIGREFNENRIINCNRYNSFDEVIERIKLIDNDDELYIRIMNEPIATGFNYTETMRGFEKFLQHIIDQPLAEARRRKLHPFRAATIEENERLSIAHMKRKDRFRKFLAFAYRPFKKLKSLERIKQRFLIKRASRVMKNSQH